MKFLSKKKDSFEILRFLLYKVIDNGNLQNIPNIIFTIIFDKKLEV